MSSVSRWDLSEVLAEEMLDFLEEYCMFEDHILVWGDYKLGIHPNG